MCVGGGGGGRVGSHPLCAGQACLPGRFFAAAAAAGGPGCEGARARAQGLIRNWRPLIEERIANYKAAGVL